MSFEIIDFHTHPFLDARSNICSHKSYLNLSADNIKDDMQSLGISHICGSVICSKPLDEENDWQRLQRANDCAMKLKCMLGDFYTPGFHIHPDYPEQSLALMHEMHKAGIRLIGEIVPYSSGWSDLNSKNHDMLLDEAEKLGMVYSFHSDENFDATDEMVRRHKNLTIVAAHPGEYKRLIRHIERTKISENYYLDLSGTGLFRHGMLAHAVKEMGADHVLFGTDYPTCTPGMYVGGVLYDKALTDSEKELVLSGNAKRLLGL